MSMWALLRGLVVALLIISVVVQHPEDFISVATEMFNMFKNLITNPWDHISSRVIVIAMTNVLEYDSLSDGNYTLDSGGRGHFSTPPPSVISPYTTVFCIFTTPLILMGGVGGEIEYRVNVGGHHPAGQLVVTWIAHFAGMKSTRTASIKWTPEEPDFCTPSHYTSENYDSTHYDSIDCLAKSFDSRVMVKDECEKYASTSLPCTSVKDGVVGWSFIGRTGQAVLVVTIWEMERGVHLLPEMDDEKDPASTETEDPIAMRALMQDMRGFGSITAVLRYFEHLRRKRAL